MEFWEVLLFTFRCMFFLSHYSSARIHHRFFHSAYGRLWGICGYGAIVLGEMGKSHDNELCISVSLSLFSLVLHWLEE
jgi:hypothetical protein